MQFGCILWVLDLSAVTIAGTSFKRVDFWLTG